MHVQPLRNAVRNLLLADVALLLGLAAGQSLAAPWSFGVISDTQWTIADDGKNPNTCAADIIKQIDKQFIEKKVDLVVHVGDMVNTGSQANDHARALYAQDLYNKGIGFYPLRGNHEAANGSYTGSGADFLRAYPQIVPGTTAGVNNATPDDITTAVINPQGDLANNPPDEKTNNLSFVVGDDFTAPTSVNAETGGVSYAFSHKNVTFVLLDQFKSPDYYASYIPEQQGWIDDTLSERPANTHAFAFTHKNILGGNHKDSMFGGAATNDPGDGSYLCSASGVPTAEGLVCLINDDASIGGGNPDVDTVGEKKDAENKLLASLELYNVKYVISGHDHHHYNSVVTSPDGLSQVHQLITQSDSSKFYTPGLPVSPNDTPIEQDLGWVGYYIFTVDGPRVTIDYYADTTHDSSWITKAKTTPTLTFVKRSTTGYSLNGTEKRVPEGASYAMTDDTAVAATMESGFEGTEMAILDGKNGSTVKTNYGRPTEKAVNTGWAPAQAGLASDILTLWGMADLGSDQTDTYVLSMTFDKQAPRQQFGNGGFGIATRDAKGSWVNAVDLNAGGTSSFVKGAWKPGYKLGAYGVDASTKTAWAVVNHGGEFAVAAGIEPAPGHRK